jgi:hypothetical protein
MNKTASRSPWRRTLLLSGTYLCVLTGFAKLFEAVLGDAHGLAAWLSPLGPWLLAGLAYRQSKREPREENGEA